jgi:2-oxoglutarate ferredoxin oxidoreductase subunit gamma
VSDAREYQLRLSGTGGQGMILAGRMLADTLIAAGLRVSQSTTYEPTSRGGVSRCDLIVSQAEVEYPLVTGLDYLVVLAQSAVGISNGLINLDGIVIVDAGVVARPPQGDYRLHRLPLIETARRLGNVRVANVVSLGALLALAPVCSLEAIGATVQAYAPARFRALNAEALSAGHALGRSSVAEAGHSAAAVGDVTAARGSTTA